MKIRTEPAFKFKIIDFINDRSWLFMALSSTILAMGALWGVGLFTLEKLI